jgi:hypothetical protein
VGQSQTLQAVAQLQQDTSGCCKNMSNSEEADDHAAGLAARYTKANVADCAHLTALPCVLEFMNRTRMPSSSNSVEISATCSMRQRAGLTHKLTYLQLAG